MKKWLCLKLVGASVCWWVKFNDVVLLWIRTVDIILYIAFTLSVNMVSKMVFGFTARCLSYAACETEPCADGNEAVNPTFVNRNPRNLEQMALAVKDRGWKTTWPHRSFYHRFVSIYYSYSANFYFFFFYMLEATLNFWYFMYSNTLLNFFCWQPVEKWMC